jgi:hypothetical protein
MGQPEQTDHEAAGLGAGHRGFDRFPAPAIFAAREDLIAVDEIGQGLGFLAETMNDVAVIDHMRMGSASALGSPAARESLDGSAGEEQFDAIVEDAGLQVMADQPRGNGIEDLAQHEAA